MKNLIKLLGIIALVAVIGFAFIACPEPEPEEEGGPTSFGDKLEFSGEQVYVNKALQPYSIDLKPYDGADITFDSVFGVTSKITGGKFSFSVGVPAATDLSSDEWSYLEQSYTDFKISDPTVKSVSISSFNKGNSISLGRGNVEYSNYTYSETEGAEGSVTYEGVSFVYVDKDVTITGKGKTETETYGGVATYITKTNDLNLSLAKGWNTVYRKSEMSVSQTQLTQSATRTMSVSNPSSLKWVLEYYND